MLGDTAEKSKNPLKKAMRRRNAKTVQFAPPTYVDASDYDYSSDEGDGELFGGPEPKQVQQQDAQQQQAQQQQATQNSEAEQEDGLKVQPLKLGSGKKDANAQEGDPRASEDSAKREDVQRGSEEIFDRPMDPKVSRNGTLRNTDSFFKDENTETRKITLTPNLLRDDSSTSTTGSRERGPSLESLEKNGFADKAKDKKDKKEKKPGMLSGLFKRKDKKSKGMLDSVDSDIEKPEEADRSSPQSKPSEDSAERPSTEQSLVTPQRQPSKGKLQKSQRTRDDSPQKTKGILKTSSPTEATMQSEANSNTPTDKPIAQQTTSTLRLIQPESENSWTASAEERGLAPGANNPFTKAMKAEQVEAKPETVKQSKERIQLDDFDSDEGSDPFADPDAQAASTRLEPSQGVSRLSESPVHVSAADAQPSQLTIQDRDKENDQHLPGLTTDSSSQETSSPISTPTPEDSPMKTIPENSQLSTFRSGATPSPTNPSNSNAIPPPSRPAPVPNKEREPSPPISPDSMLPAWSDASLRAYLDDGSEIRDMLLVVNDTTGVVPVGKDHPFMKDLFVEESKTVQGLSGELDRLLNALVEKRMRRAGSSASKASTTRSIDETARGVGGR